jgi:hypothetical protein
MVVLVIILCLILLKLKLLFNNKSIFILQLQNLILLFRILMLFKPEFADLSFSTSDCLFILRKRRIIDINIIIVRRMMMMMIKIIEFLKREIIRVLGCFICSSQLHNQEFLLKLLLRSLRPVFSTTAVILITPTGLIILMMIIIIIIIIIIIVLAHIIVKINILICIASTTAVTISIIFTIVLFTFFLIRIILVF